MKITNTEVFGLQRSIKASKYAMAVDIDKCNEDITKTVKGLGHSEGASGHPNFLKGIMIYATFEAPQYFWLQWQRYHFNHSTPLSDIITSQSKMHKILKMDLRKQCNKYTPLESIKVVEDLVYKYNNFDRYSTNGKIMVEFANGIDIVDKKELFHCIVAACPSGLNLSVEIVTNYLQIKNMYSQRNTHKLFDWKNDFCDWAESLPKFKELILE